MEEDGSMAVFSVHENREGRVSVLCQAIVGEIEGKKAESFHVGTSN